MAATFTEDNIKELKYRLEDAAIKCSERCLYQSAKWYKPPCFYTPTQLSDC